MTTIKKVLIVSFGFSVHTRSLVLALSKNELVQVELLTSDLVNNFLPDKELQKIKIYKSKYLGYKTGEKVGFYRKYSNALLRQFYFILAFLKTGKYDFIEIHYPITEILSLHFLWKLKAKKLGICFWGDDFQLMPKTYNYFFTKLVPQISYIITGNSDFKAKIIEKYAFDESNIHLIGFGSSIIEQIMENLNNKELYKKELGLPSDRLILTLAHNGSRRQNHLLMIDSLATCSAYFDKIFVIVPISHPKDDVYYNEIRTRLDKLQGLKYQMITNFLETQTVMKYRIINDLFVHMQETDSFSTSMAEFFCAGSIVINGEWLVFQDFNNAGGVDIKASKEGLGLIYLQTLQKWDKLNINKDLNSSIAYEMKSWSSNSKKWTNIYLN
jgi:hypothetical protein